MSRKKIMVMAVILSALPVAGMAQYDSKADFEMFCSGCHPDGGNPVNPAKTLRRMDREANGIKRADDIVKIMRRPGQGMRTFTKKDISNKRARALAEYILVTY
jgi:cytochrome c6